MSRPLPICPVCQRRGWNAQKPAQWTINRGRVPKFRGQLRGLVNDGDGQLRVYRCGSELGLFHVTNLTADQFEFVIAPKLLDLPAAPLPIPDRAQTQQWLEYQDRVVAVLAVAIQEQPRGLAVPRTSVVAARYEVRAGLILREVKTFAAAGLLRKIGALYVTGAVRVSEAPAS